MPLDEALSRVVLDISGRPGLEFGCAFTRAAIGEFDVDLVHEFFQGFVNHANVTLHIDNLKGHNAHHQAETIFKAFGRAFAWLWSWIHVWQASCHPQKEVCKAFATSDDESSVKT